MKNKIFLLASVVLLGLFTACDDDYSNQFNITDTINDVKSMNIVLENADYKAIADLAANKELATSKDPETLYYLDALKRVGSEGYFNEDAPADEYIANWLANKYYNATLGSKFVVTYKEYQEPSGYLDQFDKITTYTLSDKDYKNVWGKSLEAAFLSPSSLSKIPGILAENVTGAESGDMVVVNYNYSQTEPSKGGTEPETVYQLVTDFDGAGTYVIASNPTGSDYYPFGYLQDESKTYGYMYGNPITPEDGIISAEDGKAITVTFEESANGFTMKNTWGQYIYQSGNYNSFNVMTSLPTEGSEWVVNKNDNGTFSIVNVEKNKTVKLNYYKEAYSYGSYPESSYAYSYLKETMLDGESTFVIKNAVLPEGIDHVWALDNAYGWKASAYVGGKNYASESWIVSPEIDLSKGKVPQLSFDHVWRFGANRETELTLWISSDYADDVTTATWEQLTVPTWPEGKNWTFINSGVIDLSAYNGKKVVIAFKYISSDTAAATWEIKNLMVREKPADNYWDVYLFKAISEEDVTTRSEEVGGNAAGLYVFDGNAWKEYTNDAAKVAVVDPSVYASLGKDYIPNPETVLPAFLRLKLPYAEEGEKAVVIYNKSSNTPVAAEYTLNGNWDVTSAYATATLPFTVDLDGVNANISTYLDETFLTGDGGFTIQDIALDGMTYLWRLDTRYGWRASGYFNGSNRNAESWIVSPALNLKKAKNPVMTFDEAHRYLNGIAPSNYLKVKVSTDYKGDVTKCTWTELNVPNWSDGATWDYVNVGTISLSQFIGSSIRVAFIYKSDANAAATWEIKNLLIHEVE